MNSLTRLNEGLQLKKKEFEDREVIFKQRRADLMKIGDEKQRLEERRRIEKDEERLQQEEEILSIERKSLFQKVQEIKPMPEIYHKPSKIINFIRDISRPAALKLNKMGPDWRDIMTLIGKVPVDKFLNITYLRTKLFETIFSAIKLTKDSPLYTTFNSLLGHVWFVLEPIVEFVEWSTKTLMSMLKSIIESRNVKWFEMYYADFINLYTSLFHNVVGVIPEFFIIMYSNFFQLWYHLYVWGNKTMLKIVKRII